ncbi:DUF1441 family protein [Salmonella enterica subsp. enterica serovar Thompson]|nr:DUF1441 family protein [Salmonella enterica]EED8334324.1 DUF1441 family protein [Salmonella enterica subsp. enterica serovar Thompson]EGG4935896.1 DUF1441 family protein [Salmonella enterica]
MDGELKNLKCNISQLAAITGLHRQTVVSRLSGVPLAPGSNEKNKLYLLTDVIRVLMEAPVSQAAEHQDPNKMGEAGPEAILPLRRGADGKLGVVAAGSGGMAMFAPEYNIEIHNDAGNGQIGPQALQAVYNIGKKAAIDFWQQQSRDGGIAGGGR